MNVQNKSIRLGLLAIWLLLTPLMMVGQTAKEVVKEMNKTYASLSGFQMEVKMVVKDANGAVVSSYRGESAKNGASFYSEIMGKKMLVNNNYMVSVDESQKLIVVGEKPKEQATQQNDPSAMIDQLFEQSKQVMSFYKKADDRYYIRVEMKDDPLYEHVDLVVRKKDHALLHFAYQVKSDSEVSYERIEIDYSNVQLNPGAGKSKFSEKQFVTVSAKKVTPVSKYKDYQIIDQRQQAYEVD